MIPSANAHAQNGFTLVEVLVALFIMGVATASILVLIGQNTRFQVQGEERLLAGIVADNVMVETLADPVQLDIGETQGEITLGGRDWTYERIVGKTTIPGLVTIGVKVRNAASPQVITTITTLKSEAAL